MFKENHFIFYIVFEKNDKIDYIFFLYCFFDINSTESTSHVNKIFPLYSFRTHTLNRTKFH